MDQMGNEIEIDETGWANWNLVKKFSVKKNTKNHPTKNFPCLFTKLGISSPKLRDECFDRRNLGSHPSSAATPGSPQYMGQDRATCWGHPGVNFTLWSLRHTPFHHVVTGPNVRSESIVGWLGRCGSHVESGGKVRKNCIACQNS